MPNQEILNYINQARSAGQSDEQIKQALQASGWGETDINEAFESSPLSNTVSTGKTSLRFLTKKVVLVIIGAAVIGGGVFGAYYFLGQRGPENGTQQSNQQANCDTSFADLKPYPGSSKIDDGSESYQVAGYNNIRCVHDSSVSKVRDYFNNQLGKEWMLVGFRDHGGDSELEISDSKEFRACDNEKMMEVAVFEGSYVVTLWDKDFKDSYSSGVSNLCTEEKFREMGFSFSKEEASKNIVALKKSTNKCELSKISRDLKPYPNSVPVHAAFNMPFTIDGQTMALVDQVTCIAENATSEQYKDHFVNLLQSKGWTIKIESEETPFGNAYQISAKKGQEEIGITTHFAGYNVGKFKF